MKVAIIGSPKSGTTIIYETAKPGMPSNAFCLFEPGSVDEYRYLRRLQRRSVLTKVMVHRLDQIAFDAADMDQVVVVRRDPRDVLVSSLLYRFNRTGMISNAPKLERCLTRFAAKQENPAQVSLGSLFALFGSDAGQKAVESLVRQNELLAKLAQSGNAVQLRYEDFLVDGVQSLSFLKSRVHREVGSLDGWTAKISRKGVAGDWKNWFTEDDHWLHEALLPALSDAGYDTEFSIPPSQFIDSQHCTGYIENLIQRRRSNSDPTSSESVSTLLSAVRDGRRESMHELALHLSDSEIAAADEFRCADLMLLSVELGHEPAIKSLLGSRKLCAKLSWRDRWRVLSAPVANGDRFELMKCFLRNP